MQITWKNVNLYRGANKIHSVLDPEHTRRLFNLIFIENGAWEFRLDEILYVYKYNLLLKKYPAII